LVAASRPLARPVCHAHLTTPSDEDPRVFREVVGKVFTAAVGHG
jgi:hypothetical protein